MQLRFPVLQVFSKTPCSRGGNLNKNYISKYEAVLALTVSFIEVAYLKEVDKKMRKVKTRLNCFGRLRLQMPWCS